MITVGHLGNRADPQYMDWVEYLLSFLRPLSLDGKFVYTFPTFLLTLFGTASALLWMFRRDTPTARRFAALCFIWVYLLHCYVVYKVFPFLHPERNHARYLLAMAVLGFALAVCALPEWCELFRKLPQRHAYWVIPVLAWLLTVVFLVISAINPLCNGEHLGRVISQRQLLIRDGRPVLLRLRPKNGELEKGEEKFSRMYITMFAPFEEFVKNIDSPRPWYEDERGRCYMLLWGEVPEGQPCRARLCDSYFCKSAQLVLKRAKNR